MPLGMQDLKSCHQELNLSALQWKQSLKHWAAREVLHHYLLVGSIS